MRYLFITIICLYSFNSYADCSHCLYGPDSWRTKPAYEQSQARGSLIVQDKWRTEFGSNCLRVNELEEEMLYIFRSVPQRNIVARCRQEGYHDGANSELDAINNFCEILGGEDGYEVGLYEGEVFCRTELSSRGYPEEFRNGCTKGFRKAVSKFCPQKMDSSAMKGTMYSVCDVY